VTCQRIVGPAQYLQEIPEVLQRQLPATAQAPFTVTIATTPAVGSSCLSPHD
jgi:GTP1/Obg family GTP-binding protein